MGRDRSPTLKSRLAALRWGGYSFLIGVFVRKIKSLLIALILVLSLSVSSFASPLLAIPAIAYVAAAIFHAQVAAGLYYYMKPSTPSVVSPSGNISRPSEAVWIDLNLPTPALQTKALNAQMSKEKLRELAANKTKYPLVSAALEKDGLLNYPPIPSSLTTTALAVGAKASVNGVAVTITGVSACNLWITSSGYLSETNATYSPCRAATEAEAGVGVSYNVSRLYTHANVVPAPIPVKIPLTDAEIPAALGQTPTGGPVKTALQAELDKMFQDENYVPTFSDATTGLPDVPPPNVASPEQVTSYNNNVAAAAATAAASAAAQNSATVAASTAASAGAASTAATAAAAAAGGTDSGLNAAAAAAAAAAGAANNAAAAAAADAAAAAAAEAQTAASVAAGLPAKPSKNVVDFAPMRNLKDVLENTYPFNLPSSVVGYFSAFNGVGAAPVFDLPMPLGQTIHCDLSFFNPVAALIRYLVGMLTTVGITFYIIHFYRGIS